MSLSNMTGITPIPERSDATPGLWNKGYDTIDANFASVQSTINNALSSWSILPWETGVKDLRYFYGDARRFGLGTGVVSDTAAVLATFSSATSGGSIYLPGVSNITAGMTVGVHSLTIYGDGPSSLLTGVMSTGSDAVILSDQKNNLTVRDLAIGGSHSWGIFVAGGVGHQIVRNRVQGGIQQLNGKGGGIYVESTENVLIVFNSCSSNGTSNTAHENFFDICANSGDSQFLKHSHVLINDCSSTSVNVNIMLFNPLRVEIRGNRATGAITPTALIRGGYGIGLYRTSGTPGANIGECIVDGNYVHNVQGCGIYNAVCRDSVFNANIIHDVGSVQQDVSISVGGIGNEGDRCVFSNNRISASSKDGITVAGNDCVVSGNDIDNISLNGISVRGAQRNALIVGNSVASIGVTAIGSWGDAASVGVRVIGNSIGTLSIPGATSGILMPVSADAWTILGNTLSHDNGQVLIAVNGTNPFVGLNRIPGAIVTQMPRTVTSDGSVLGPGVAFSSESSLGFYRSAASTVALSYGTMALPNVSASGPYTYLGSGMAFASKSAGASSAFFRLANTSGQLDIGLGGSGAGFLFTGDTPYSAVFGTQTPFATHLGSNGVIRMTIGSGGSISLLQNPLLSLRTLPSSSITASAALTNVAVNETVFTVGGASGASFGIMSGGTFYGFTSSFSAKAT